ncbi:deleted in malignant brain tumors 1 protein-like isoform X5 [Sparus aurata]|uniref:deleted in malignant brain tumors 1 protein-like isoform X5 n=1 Tax=Sparus aurata TaxID=8175 RepID=UPI0011C0D9BE|nr:deleted in malignant brain tumors 1 protein-like isoform X5 [Sparus aurata]
MWTLVVLCSVIASCGVRGDNWWTTLAQPEETVTSDASCGGYLHSSSGTFYSPGYPDNYPDHSECIWYLRFGSGIVQLNFPFISIEDHPSCMYDAIYVYDGFNTAYRLLGKVCGNTTATFYSTGVYMTVRFKSDGSISSSGFRADYRVVAQGSCRYNCGYQVGSCSCSSSCEYRGNCCSDYYDYCLASTPETPSTPGDNWWTVDDVVTDQPSCRYNCGSHMGSCSCSSSCQYYGNCCHDYHYECLETTTVPVTTADNREPTHDYFTDFYPSCRYNCGSHMGMCSCENSCQYYGNCCHDYYYECSETTPEAPSTPDYTSCGGYLYGYSGSFTSPNYPSAYPHYADCIWYIRPGYSVIRLWFSSVNIESCGNCGCDSVSVYDGSSTSSSLLGKVCGRNTATFYSTGSYLTVRFRTDSSASYSGFRAFYENGDYFSTESPVTEQPSCRYNCGWNLGSCSCTSSCQYNGNCCPDYYDHCSSTTEWPTTEHPSCRYNCGWNLGSCSCTSSCQYYGNCCPDYYDECSATTPEAPSTTGDNWWTVDDVVTDQPSCRYNCGSHMGSCSCSSSCQYYGNCCHDYYYECSETTPEAPSTPDYTSCGDYLYGYSGSFTSPNYPSAYPHYADCIWYIRPGYSVIRLRFSSVNIESCGNCGCDSVSVYDGSSTSSRLLGKVCGRNTATFYSTGSYLTVRFRTDSSASYSGFQAYYEVGDFFSTESPVTDYFSTESPVTEQPSCRYNCGWDLGSCSCTSSCQYYGNCCPDYHDHCSSTTEWPTTEHPSCRYNCGWNLGSCSCTSSCQYYGNCCPDYYDECSATTPEAPSTTGDNWWTVDDVVTDQPSCRYNCGSHMGSCSCSSSCQYYGNCCHDYYYECSETTPEAPSTTDQPSCRYNCGSHMGSCSCSSSCQYYGNCCHDYYYECPTSTMEPEVTTDQLSCRYNCGSHMGSCSCSSSCQLYGNCCHDYYYYCPASTTEPVSPDYTSCGGYLYAYSRSFTSPNYPSAYPHYADCIWYIRPGYSVIRLQFSSVNIESCGNCGCDSVSVYDGSSTSSRLLGKVCGRNTATFYSTGSYLTVRFRTDSSVSYSGFRASYEVVDNFSTESPVTEQPSCRYNCGWNLGSCSCTSSCQYYGNCCPDYYDHCSSTTEWPTTAQPSCRHNCGWNLGSCSCSSSCRYNGNCCPDYYDYCSSTTEWPTTATPCGGYLFGSGNFTSPNHPSFYPDNTYCTWRLRASSDQRIFLAFTYLQLESCCECDYIKVYDGSSYMGTMCNNSLATFHSSSNSMTVVFRSDSRVVARGFRAEFISSLPTSSGQVTCSSDNMNIVVQRSYLNSLGYDGDNLYLNNPSCRPQISSSQVIFRFPIEGCGNDKKIENGRVVYTNTLRADTSSYGEITRQVHLKINVACQMDQDSVSQIMYLVEHTGNSSIVGTGKFNTSMNFYTSGSFYYQVTQVPYKVTLNQNLYVQVDLSRQSSNLVIFLDTCVTSPSPHDFENRSYYLVRNGCPVDSTYRPYYTGLRPYARFTFKAFQFLRAAESVYIQCKVLICQASDSNSRCHNPPNCRNRVARDLGTEHDSQTLVLGPIQLRASEKKEEGTKEQDEA